MQRYVPPKDIAAVLYRAFWKKDKGFKFYKLTSLIKMDGTPSHSRNPSNI